MIFCVMNKKDDCCIPQEYSDITLMKEVARGNEIAYGIIIDRYIDSVSRTAFRIMCNREDSEAVTVKVFVNFWHDVLDYDDRFTLDKWLLRKTCLYCRIRIMRRRILRIFGVTSDVFVQASPKVEDQDDYVTKQAWELFCRASTHLTPLQSVSYALCVLEGLSEETVSGMLGLSRFRIGLALQRGSGTIQRELRSYGKEYDYEKYVIFLRKVAESLTDAERLKKAIMAEI